MTNPSRIGYASTALVMIALMAGIVAGWVWT